ncbi:MAG: Fur family transcriptional regulator [Actinomycetota bacterium]
MSTDVLHDDVADLLRAADHRYTSGRRRVVAVLREAPGPVTIPQVLELDRTLAQSSVYRNLAILEEVGAVSRIVTHDDHARYELAEGLTDHHHHHLICSTCGDVSDFELSHEVERSLDRAFRTASRRAGFRLDGHRLDLLGSCASCA